MTIHDMRLNPQIFDRIKSGIKTLELRINDDKRRAVKVGDTIQFSKRPAMDEKLTTNVISLHIHPTFAELFDQVNLGWLGYTQADKSWLNDSMYGIYSREEEAQYGVIGIRIALEG